MNEEKFKEQQARVEAYFEKWLTPLGLRWWTIDFIWRDDGCDRRRDTPTRRCAMHTFASWPYSEAAITVHVERLASVTDEKLEWIVVHELCHILVNEMRENDIDHEERVTSALASAFLWTREAGEKAAKEQGGQQ